MARRRAIRDRTSFALMERLGVIQAAIFNPEFAAYRPGSGRKRPV
jgi:uncharacterized protein